jgi:hypothetical protein
LELAINGDKTNNLELQAGDIVNVLSIKDVRNPARRGVMYVFIDGEVNRPGVYELRPGQNLIDAIRILNNYPFEIKIYDVEIRARYLIETDKDINLKVTDRVRAWTTRSAPAQLPNYGFILKQDVEFVDNNNYQPQLKYFSVDTNTIYPPDLQISWDDFSWNTGSSTQTVLNTLPANINLAENPGVFYSQSINRFRINARPEYPVQLWTTGSVYLNNYFLPSGSTTYAIKDLETNEYIVDFNNTYTQVSADATSSYFDVYMDFLQPERYYTILIKTTIDGSTIVFNNQYSFKVVNG